MKSYTTAN